MSAPRMKSSDKRKEVEYFVSVLYVTLKEMHVAFKENDKKRASLRGAFLSECFSVWTDFPV